MKPINTQFFLNNPYFLSNGNVKEVYLYVQLQAEAAQTDKKRLPLNISLVIDRSGSMGGDKIIYAKKAADFVIKQLSPDDMLSLVQYDDVVEVIYAAEKVKNKEILHQKVAKIAARNMTNLSGGMMEGYNQTRKLKAEGQVNRILLLSDGLANAGITDAEQLQLIAKKVFENDGIALSTFGVGADFDEKLMTNLSESGGGNYYFIDAPDKIPPIFAQELSGLLAVVAQNARLQVKIPASHFQVNKVYGYPFNVKDEVLTVNFNDVFSQEEKAVLIRLDVIQSLQTDMQFDLSFEYDDVHISMGKVSEEAQLFLRTTSDKELYNSGVNAKVLEQMALFVSNDLFEHALEASDSRDFVQARSKVKDSLAQLKILKEMLGGNESERLLAQEKLMEEYEARLGDMESMSNNDLLMAQKMSKMSNYSSRKMK